MQVTTTDIVQASVASTSISITNLVIFSEPVYFWLAVASAFVGLISSLNDLDEVEQLKRDFHTLFTAFKGAFLGFFSAPGMFIFLNIFGQQVFLNVGLKIEDNNIYLLTFYWIVSIVFSRVIISFFFKRIEKK